jgi:long-chain fatty acid transport protein
MCTCSRRSVSFLAALVAAALGLAPADSAAAGFAVFEQGARAMGFAGAFTAQASDPSAIFHNAAGLAFLRGQQFYAGGTLIAPSATFRGADPFPGSAVTEKADMGLLVPAAAYYTHQFSERLVLGAGWMTPFALQTGWANPDEFTGRFVSQAAEIKSHSLNPTVAYKVKDRLAVGMGLDVRFSSLVFTRSLPAIDPVTQTFTDAATERVRSGTGVGYGFDVGALARPMDNLSVGVSYRHKVSVPFHGDATFSPVSTGNAEQDAATAAFLPPGSVPFNSEVVFPAIASVGAAYTWNEWTVEADVNWYQWSTFDRLILTFEGRPDLNHAVIEDYANSWQYRMGVEGPLGGGWTARAGYFYDQSPAPAASLSPLLPDSDRHGLALGASWKPGRWRMDAASWILLGGRRSTLGQSRDRYDGEYEAHAVTLGVSVGYGF